MTGQLLQNLAAGAVVLAAGAYIARRAWGRIVAARRPRSSPCGPECGCGKSDY